MRLALYFTWALSMIGMTTADASTSVYYDSLTGFTFSQATVKYDLNGGQITFRLAVPTDVSPGAAYPVVIQVVAPSAVGWTGLAWNGGMTNNPLTLSWQNGQSAQVSSRWATAHSAPSPYTGATYSVFKTGTRYNGTHWQLTVKCDGCTSWKSTTLSPTSIHRLAFAYCDTKPSNPSSNTSSITVHDVHDYWNHDFSTGQNPAFSQLVARNQG